MAETELQLCASCQRYVSEPCRVPAMCPNNQAARIERSASPEDEGRTTTRHTLKVSLPNGTKIKLERKRTRR